jgi:hypothetical protein
MKALFYKIILVLTCLNASCSDKFESNILYKDVKLKNSLPHDLEKGDCNYLVITEGVRHSKKNSGHGYADTLFIKVEDMTKIGTKQLVEEISYNCVLRGLNWGVYPKSKQTNVELTILSLNDTSAEIKVDAKVHLRAYVKVLDAANEYENSRIEKFEKGRLGGVDIYWLDSTRVFTLSSKVRETILRTGVEKEVIRHSLN